MTRHDGRRAHQIRPVQIQCGYTKYAPGSVLFAMGETRVLVTAMVEEKTPRHVPDGEGWLTAEYSMLPGATEPRAHRERLKVSGRTTEIQRLIGRSLRACLDMKKLGERTITIDADVLQADGGTRTASITAAYIALAEAIKQLQEKGLLKESPIINQIAAISIGLVEDEVLLDLNYVEDSTAQVDANLIMTANGDIIEFQTTSERAPLSREQLNMFLDVGYQGIQELFTHQDEALGIKQPVTAG